MTDLILTDQALPLDRHPAAVYLASLAPGSQPTMEEALHIMAGLLTGGQADAFSINWGAVRYQHAQALRAKLADQYAFSTCNKMLAGLRRVCKEAWKLGYMSAQDYQLIATVERVKGETVLAGRHVAPGEIQALARVCKEDPGPAGARDAAIIALLYAAGLRRAELVSLDIDDYEELEGAAGKLKVQGKGNKERFVYVDNGAADAMLSWLHTRGGGRPGALFIPINKGGRLIYGERLTSQAVYNMLKKRAKQAEVKEFSPHDLRRTFATELLEAGADVLVVSAMMGHANPQTTGKYDRRPEEAKRRAAKLLYFPWKGQV